MSEFDGFKSAHFDAYEQRKWSMGRFNLERMRVREHAEGLGRALLGGLGERGLALRSSQDHPTIFNDKKVDAQWVVLGRADATRRPLKPLLVRERNLAHEAESALPQKQEAVLSLRVDVGGVEVALRLHRAAAMDRKNLATALAGDAVKTQFNTLLSGLPDGTVVQVGDVVVPASEANATAVADGLANGAEWLMVGRAYGRGEAVVGQADFVAEANRVIEALLPLYDLCAWSAHNDLIGGQALLETVAAAPVAAVAPEPVSSEPKAEPEPETEPEPKPDTEKTPQTASPSATETPAEPPRAKPVPAAPTKAPAAHQQPKRPRQRRKPTTKGGGSYRPDWQFKTDAEKDAVGPVTPSKRVRERAQEAARAAADGWTYSGPVKEPEGNRPPPQDQPQRQGGDPPRNRGPRPDSGRPDQGPRPNQGPPQGGNRGHQGGGRGPNDRGGPTSGGPRDQRGGPGDQRRGPGDQRDGPGNRNRPNDRRPDGGGRGQGRPPQRNDRGRGGDRGFDGGGRGQGRGDGRGRGPKGPIVAAAKKVENWKDGTGDAALDDHVRVTGGLFSGKIGKVVEETRKGYKVAVGDMVFEVKKGDTNRVVEA